MNSVMNISIILTGCLTLTLPSSTWAGVLMIVSDEHDDLAVLSDIRDDKSMKRHRRDIDDMRFDVFTTRQKIIKIFGKPVPQPKPKSVVSIGEDRFYSAPGGGTRPGPTFRWEYYVKQRVCLRAFIRDGDNKLIHTVMCFKKDKGFRPASRDKKAIAQRIQWEKVRLEEFKKAMSKKP